MAIRRAPSLEASHLQGSLSQHPQTSMAVFIAAEAKEIKPSAPQRGGGSRLCADGSFHSPSSLVPSSPRYNITHLAGWQGHPAQPWQRSRDPRAMLQSHHPSAKGLLSFHGGSTCTPILMSGTPQGLKALSSEERSLSWASCSHPLASGDLRAQL